MKMDYVTIFFMILTFAGIFWASASGRCQVPSDSLNLVSLQGEIAYNQTFRHDNCSWNLRHVNESKYVLLIYLKDIQMVYTDNDRRGCSGHLILPGTTPFCEMPKTRCIVYSTSESSCNFANVSAIANNISTTCSSILWHSVQTLPWTIKAKANQPDKKTFSLFYKFISCGNCGSPGVPAFKANKSTVDMGNRTIAQTSSNTFEGPLIAVSVILAVIVTLVVLYFAYKKFIPRRTRGEKPEPRETSQEFIAGPDVELNQCNSRTDPAFNGNIETNEYEEIPTERLGSNSREANAVANASY